MENWFYYVQSLVIGNGYVNLLWKLLLMDNRQGKQVIYYIQSIIKKKKKFENMMAMQAQKQLMV